MTMRQKIESLTLFDSDMMKLVHGGDPVGNGGVEDAMIMETRESLRRSSQQSISAAVLVSLAHKRYERRRLAAMEIRLGRYQRRRRRIHDDVSIVCTTLGHCIVRKRRS